ncbi:hypothetical protein [Microbacterium sp. E-13]|uniref:hypothetical protein n=1 Tax=Microbacterium sp. E-13 TaxID=3404048 RepID=UPI003CFB6807
MEAKASRGVLATIWGLVLVGVVLLIWWAFAVYAYGIEVDEHALAPTSRPGDVALFALGVLSLAAAALLPILDRRRVQHRL